jgi:hypothetical protein
MTAGSKVVEAVVMDSPVMPENGTTSTAQGTERTMKTSLTEFHHSRDCIYRECRPEGQLQRSTPDNLSILLL